MRFLKVAKEKIYKFNETLNPKLWDGFELKEEVKEKLLEIAKSFIDFMELDYEAVKDIVVMGSSANYNYTKYSDLDLHLLIDFDLVHKDCPIVTGYLWASKALFNKEHEISIYDIPVEVYAQNYKEDMISNGVYSLTHNKWLSKPKKTKVFINDTSLKIKEKYFVEEIKNLLSNKVDKDAIQEMLDKLYKLRKTGLDNKGEYSVENLVFKDIRNKGLLDALKKVKKQKEDETLSLK